MQNVNSNPVPVGDYLQSGAFAALLEAVQNFCRYIEDETETDGEVFLRVVQKQLVVTAPPTWALTAPYFY